MDDTKAQERSQDVFEHIDGYQKPPLIPLPKLEDLSSFHNNDIPAGSFAHRMMMAAFSMVGFNGFRKRLPDHLEPLLRRTNLRTPGLLAPAITATLALANDPRHLTPLQRAATLVIGARKLRDDIFSAALPQDILGGQPLEMGQYPNLFSTSISINKSGARIYKSQNTSRIIVAINGRHYALEIDGPEYLVSSAHLTRALEEIVATESRQGDLTEPQIGLLTNATNRTQLRAFQRLNQVETNQHSLSIIKNCLLTLCLDLEDKPGSYESALYKSHSTNFHNRWSHSSLQLVVFGDTKACAICNFTTYLDGNTMVRGVDEIHKRALAVPVSPGDDHDTSFHTAEKLNWQVDPKLIHRAQREIQGLLDLQQASCTIDCFGRDSFREHDIDQVSVFIIALQMTVRGLIGKSAKIDQFLAMTKYRCMDLTTAIVSTPQVDQFCSHLETEGFGRREAIYYLKSAIDSQRLVARKKRQYLPLDTTLALFLRTRNGLGNILGVITVLLILFFQLIGWKRSEQKEIIVSHPAIYPGVPLLGRPGIRLPYVKYFGLHYQIFERRTVVTMMPGLNWKVPNALVIEKLESNLLKILSLFNNDNGNGADLNHA